MEFWQGTSTCTVANECLFMWGVFFIWVLIINVVVVTKIGAYIYYFLWVLIIRCVIFDVYPHILLVNFSDITQKLFLHDCIIVNRQCKYLYLTLCIKFIN